MSEWISTDDRLPDEGVNVLCKQIHNSELMLCYIKDGYWHESYEEIECCGGGWIDNSIVDASDLSHYLRITHWMPLPEPPKDL